MPNATAQNLLNLLNFGNPYGQHTNSSRPSSLSGFQTFSNQPRQESPFTAADLLKQTAASGKSDAVPKPHQSTAPAAVKDRPQDDPVTSTTPQTEQESQKSIFTYKNPFEALRASRPHTPKTHQQPTVETPRQETPQRDVPVASVENHTEITEPSTAERVKLQPKSRASRQSTPAHPVETVPEPQVKQEEANLTQSDEIDPPPQELTAEQSALIEAVSSVTKMYDSGGGMPQTNGTSDRVVPVITFPVKAFISITLESQPPASSTVRDDGVMEISRLKKEFDQMDRSLAAASSKYITYALVKNGGLRIIRQDDGKDRHIFKHTHDRIFNVAVCTSSVTAPLTAHQAVLGTGVSGAVYYATISKENADFFDANSLETESLIFPPFPQADENTAGGVLKTRAKRSSRHPDFFAIGRGKAIHIVWPGTVMNSAFDVTAEQRTVNVEKLFVERPLQILTGKAGKDFTFSEDDTMIVSLDKTGRLRFWDIRKLIDQDNARSVHITPYIIDTPVLTLATASPSERSWPTSVHFLDKARPYTKGGALRYVLVGLRQNHTLQLWDIALGKAVQEINFPHTSETDPICSVAYHPPSGVIAVGHPTRNAIFFIHISAPRYMLSSSLSQASFVQRVAAKDTDIPKPESTACMSGIRELSFSGHGNLRSVELLPVNKPAQAPQAEGNTLSESNDALFELYVAHSTGVTCLFINKEDLGWDADSKPVQSINAEAEGLVSLKELKLGSVIEENTRAKSPVAEPQAPTKSEKKKKSKKTKDIGGESVNGTTDTVVEASKALEAVSEAVANDAVAVEQQSTKEAKKSKKKKDVATDIIPEHRVESLTKPEKASAIAGDASLVPQQSTSASASDQVSMSISGDWLDKEMRILEKAISGGLKNELDQLYQNIKTDRSSQDQASASRQEAVLRVVSNTLNTNVEKTLSSILRAQMQEVVVPSVVETVSKDLSEQISTTVSQVVKKELGSELPAQLDRTLQSPQMLTSITDSIATRINGQIEQDITKTISGTVSSTMTSIATSTAAEVVAAAESRMADQVAHMSKQHAVFSEKIEELNGALQSVTASLQSMMQAQTAFQAQIIQDLRQSRSQELSRPTSARPVSTTFSPPPSARAVPTARQKSKSEMEIDEITSLMDQRKYEEGSIKWLQSSQPAKLFDDLFVRFTPDYLATDVTPLVAFSIGVTVANSLSTNTQRRLEWIDAAFQTVDFKVRGFFLLELNH